MTAPAAPVKSRRPWRKLAVGVSAFLLAPLVPAFRAILPIEQTPLMLIVIVASCAIVGWIRGGRFALPLIWVVIAAVLLTSNAGPPEGAYNGMARGWTLMIAATFGLVSLVASSEAFFPRALSALAVSIALGFGIVLVSQGGTGRVLATMTGEIDRRVGESNKALRDAVSQPEWKAMVEGSDRLGRLTKESELQLAAIPKWSVMLMPALLALESLAALAVGWAFYHRMSDVAIGPALGKLKDFRFNDQLVWGVAVGASVFLLKAFEEGKTAGLNLFVFFGFLYAVRGMGILAWMSRGRSMRVMLVVATMLAWYIMAPLAFLIGLGDTWVDWRSRAQQAKQQ
ncbi:MAG TPA: DUF2232 domain-containing protein [Gemmatimonadaceae bacterium]|nr:DUF2232 domain-containing protein [Gemmatimonadaceae bacterium]